MPKFLLLALALLGSSAIADLDPELNLIDQLRTGEGSVKVSTLITVEEAGSIVRSSELDVYVAKDQRTLAVYQSEREAGQKVLMVGDNFWLFLPSSKRAMRITPMQKMLGEASVGDVASLNWAEDYKVTSRITAELTTQLTLQGQRKGLSYQRIELWVDSETGHPVSGHFYLKSGKLAKTAEFDIQQQDDGQWQMVGLSLQDKVQKDQRTHIQYLSIEPMEMQNKWFTPNFLLRGAP